MPRCGRSAKSHEYGQRKTESEHEWDDIKRKMNLPTFMAKTESFSIQEMSKNKFVLECARILTRLCAKNVQNKNK